MRTPLADRYKTRRRVATLAASVPAIPCHTYFFSLFSCVPQKLSMCSVLILIEADRTSRTTAIECCSTVPYSRVKFAPYGAKIFCWAIRVSANPISELFAPEFGVFGHFAPLPSTMCSLGALQHIVTALFATSEVYSVSGRVG